MYDLTPTKGFMEDEISNHINHFHLPRSDGFSGFNVDSSLTVWSNYSDLTRRGPSKGSSGREMGPLISGKSRLVK